METAAHILLIGDDEALLEARASVLRHFWPVSAARPGHEEHLLRQADLAVLCETMPEDRRQDWIDSVRPALPKLLILKMNGYDAGPRHGADATVGLSGGPGALVSTVYGLLTERGLASRGWPSPETALLEGAVGTVVQ